MPEELHRIEPIVTKDKFECGVHRMSVPGGWIYWLTPPGALAMACFVPTPPADGYFGGRSEITRGG